MRLRGESSETAVPGRVGAVKVDRALGVWLPGASYRPRRVVGTLERIRQPPRSPRGRSTGHSSVATTRRYLHARPTDSSARYLAV